MGDARSWRWPPIGVGTALIFLAIVVGIGAAQGMAVRLASSEDARTWLPVIWHVTGAIGVWFALPIVATVVCNARIGQVAWWRVAALHVGGYATFTAAHVAVMLALRGVVGLALGRDVQSPNLLSYQIVWEAQADLVVYASAAGLLSLLDTWRERRAQALQSARLDAIATRARLDALTARLDPHFLYNALNTIGAVMHEDVDRADRMLADLGSLLRTTLRADAPTWTFERERAHTEQYVQLLSARFGDRLAVSWQIQPAAMTTIVPRFCVLTLVENAVKHNAGRIERLSIIVAARTDGHRVDVSVEDDGRGFDGDPLAHPDSGLGRLEDMMRLIHGSACRLSCRRATPVGGAAVNLSFPEVELP